MVLAITHSDYEMAKFSTYSVRCKHDYTIEQRTKGTIGFVLYSLNKAWTQAGFKYFVHPEFL